MTRGVPFAAPVAFIVEGPGLAPEAAGHVTATIRWGDGTSSAGRIEEVPGGEWVVGSHRYAKAGPFTITVMIRDDTGFTVATTTQAFDPPAGPRHHRRHHPVRRHRGSGHAPGKRVPAPPSPYARSLASGPA